MEDISGIINDANQQDYIQKIVTDDTSGVARLYRFATLSEGLAIGDIVISATFSISTKPTLSYRNICNDARMCPFCPDAKSKPIEFIARGISITAGASQELKEAFDKITSQGVTNLVCFEESTENVYMFCCPQSGELAWNGGIFQMVEVAATDKWGNRCTNTIRLLITNHA